jgi:sigma-B regulation protein RsbU (phosphoserine phosphatase)
LDLLTGEGSLASPADIATKLNHMFPMSEEAKQYFTLIFGILDTQEKTFRYVCAGHPPPILFAKGHQPIVCEGRSLPIGLFEDEQYEESTIVLEPGDRIYLYSDGVLEAMNDKREIFNETRLQTTIENTRPAGLEDSVNSIVKAVHRWNGGHQVHDDLSILAVELK